MDNITMNRLFEWVATNIRLYGYSKIYKGIYVNIKTMEAKNCMICTGIKEKDLVIISEQDGVGGWVETVQIDNIDKISHKEYIKVPLRYFAETLNGSFIYGISDLSRNDESATNFYNILSLHEDYIQNIKNYIDNNYYDEWEERLES